jgi:hypothetical protein
MKNTKDTKGTTGLALAIILSVAANANAQGARGSGVATVEFLAGQPEAGPIVPGAPYSGEATTTVTQTLADGTRIERTTTTRVYRDTDGRIRREQTLQGLGALNASGETTIITIVDPVAGVSYVLDPGTRRARRAETRRDTATVKFEELRQNLRRAEQALEVAHQNERTRGGQAPAGPAPPAPAAPLGGVADPLAPPPPPPPPPAGARGRSGSPGNVANVPQSLGTRQIEGLEAVGTRRVDVIPVGRIGNDRPIEITDERWESPALRILVQSRHSDPRTGIVEYRLTNVSRAEPSHDLFVVPSDYTVVEARNDERR